jgi:hypothetical protein
VHRNNGDHGVSRKFDNDNDRKKNEITGISDKSSKVDGTLTLSIELVPNTKPILLKFLVTFDYDGTLLIGYPTLRALGAHIDCVTGQIEYSRLERLNRSR